MPWSPSISDTYFAPVSLSQLQRIFSFSNETSASLLKFTFLSSALFGQILILHFYSLALPVIFCVTPQHTHAVLLAETLLGLAVWNERTIFTYPMALMELTQGVLQLKGDNSGDLAKS